MYIYYFLLHFPRIDEIAINDRIESYDTNRGIVEKWKVWANRRKRSDAARNLT